MNVLDKIVVEAKRADEGWGRAYPLFSRILNKYGFKTGVEIGVAFGGHAEAILKLTQVDKLYGVDPYRHYDNYKDPMNLPQSEFEILYEFTKNRLAVFGDRIDIVREISSRAAEIIKGQVDFVYVDALHTYEGVRDDLRLWFPKIRDGGVIGGHDYGHPSFPGVKNAVDEFFARFGWEVRDEGEGVWWVEKKPLQISYIVPAYNCESTVLESLDSIIHSNIEYGDEIVIVDDNSIDGTKELLKKYASEHSEVRIIEHLRNKGGAGARNTAVENANNELIFCLDSDNVLMPESVAKLKKFLIFEAAHAASFEELCYFNDDINKQTHKWIFRAGEITFEDCLASTIVPISSGNYLYTKESWRLAGGYPEQSRALDAWGFGIRQLALGQKMVVLKSTGYLHRHGHDSYWVRELKNGITSLTALQILIPFIDQLKPSTINYIMGAHGRKSWFENLESIPLRSRSCRIGRGGIILDSNGNRRFNATLLRRLRLKIRAII